MEYTTTLELSVINITKADSTQSNKMAWNNSAKGTTGTTNVHFVYYVYHMKVYENSVSSSVQTSRHI